MKRQTRSRCFWLLIAAVSSLAFLMVGCDTDNSSPDLNESTSQTEEIDDPYGGFNTSDEMTGFGDDFLMSDEGELDYEDEITDDPEVQALFDDPENALYAVRVTWGYLTRDSTNTNEPVDWSGYAEVDSGALVVARTIQFEPRQDYLIRPIRASLMLDRERIDWVSQTTVAFDGVQLLFVDPTAGEGPNSLTIEVPLFNTTIELADLEDLDRTVAVDDLGHEIRIQAAKIDLASLCGRGWMSGRWERLDVNQDDLRRGIMGRFRGHWSNRHGTVGGYMKGFYGVNRNGNRVIFGKVINRRGTFIALMRGTWMPSQDTHGAGTFRAAWIDVSHQVQGGMRGVWARRGEGMGFFHGAWRTQCDDGGEEFDPATF